MQINTYSKTTTMMNTAELKMVGGDQIVNLKAVTRPIEKIEVTIPDMFVSFMARKAVVNPHYEQVKAESEAWIAKYIFKLYD